MSRIIRDYICQFRCNGKRGWFPSNYVEIISEGESLAPLLSPKIDENILMNLVKLGNNSSESFEQPITDNWLLNDIGKIA